MNKFTRIQERLCKPSYKNLNADQKRMIKLHEEYEQLEKSISKTYQLGKLKFGENFRKDERFFEDFDLIFKWEERKLRINAAIDKLEVKTKESLNDVIRLFHAFQPSLSESF